MHTVTAKNYQEALDATRDILMMFVDIRGWSRPALSADRSRGLGHQCLVAPAASRPALVQASGAVGRSGSRVSAAVNWPWIGSFAG